MNEDPGEATFVRLVQVLGGPTQTERKKKPPAPRPVRLPGEANSDYWLRVREARLAAEEEPK